MPNMSKKVIGLTGNIACGKSSLTNYLETKGYYVIDADTITNELYEHCLEFKDGLLNLFGDVVLDENNHLDKKKVSKIVFENKKLLQKLNKIAHPIIYQRINQLIEKSNEKIIFVSAALLFEAEWQNSVDGVILVKCDKNIQIERLISRNKLTYQQAQDRVNLQMSQEEKEKKADYIIENNSSLIHLYEQIDKVINEIEKVK